MNYYFCYNGMGSVDEVKCLPEDLPGKLTYTELNFWRFFKEESEYLCDLLRDSKFSCDINAAIQNALEKKVFTANNNSKDRCIWVELNKYGIVTNVSVAYNEVGDWYYFDRFDKYKSIPTEVVLSYYSDTCRFHKANVSLIINTLLDNLGDKSVRL